MTQKISHFKDLTRRLVCSSVIVSVLIVLLVYRENPIVQGLLVLLIASLSEVYITKILWPDFGKGDLIEAIMDYQSRKRRFGK